MTQRKNNRDQIDGSRKNFRTSPKSDDEERTLTPYKESVLNFCALPRKEQRRQERRASCC